MTRLYIAIAVLVLLAAIIAGSVYIGRQWDSVDDEKAKTETLERVQNADVSKGDAKDDRAWVNDFLDGLFMD